MTGHPLEGVTVLDLTQIYNGPYATFLMAMAGAEVIKVEPPDGEHLRKRAGHGGAGIPFAMLNANKRAMSLDLKSQRGREVFLALAAQADVVIENFAPGVVDRLAIGYEAVRAVNPGVVYASGSGYGQSGRYRDFPAMDLTVQAMAGIMSTTGFPENPPVKAGGAVCDFFGGIHLYSAVMTALYRKARTGKGSRVEVAMLDAVYPSMASNIGMVLGDRDDIPLRTGNRHGGLSLCPYNVYPTRDGHIAIICNHDRHFRALLRVMGREELGDDPRYRTQPDRVQRMEEVDAMIGEWTSGHDRDPLFETLIAERVPCAPVRELPEVLRDAHLHERGMLLEVDHPDYGPIVVIRSPLHFEGQPPPEYRIARPLGADSETVLRERLGLDGDEIEELRAAGVI